MKCFFSKQKYWLSLVVILLIGAVSSLSAAVTVNNAWYGQDGQDGVNTDPLFQSIVIAKLKAVAAKYGFLVIPADMAGFFGFDPLYGTAKTTAIDATVNGVRKIDYRAPEGTDFFLPSDKANTTEGKAALAELKANPPQITKPLVSVNNAWYGTDSNDIAWIKDSNIPGVVASIGGLAKKSVVNTLPQYQPKVIAKLRAVVQKYGFLAIPADMNSFYGFDPLPGTVKTTAIDATDLVTGQRKIDYRAPENQDFLLPQNIDQAKVQQALSELKNKTFRIPEIEVSTTATTTTQVATTTATTPSISTANAYNSNAENAVFNTWKNEWQLPTAGSGVISFNVKATNDIFIGLSSTASQQDPMYTIQLSGWSERFLCGLLKTKFNSSSFAVANNLLDLNSKGTTNTTWTQTQPSFKPTGNDQITITLDSQTKTITVVANGATVFTYNDPAFLSSVKYVSFSSWNTPITYSNISFSALAAAPTTATATTSTAATQATAGSANEYMLEEGAALYVGVGNDSKKDILAWIINEDGNSLSTFNQTATDPKNVWSVAVANDANNKPLATPFSGISVSSDGVVCVLDANGKAFRYNGKTFDALIDGEATSVQFSNITVGSKDQIFALGVADDTGSSDVYRYDEKKGWSKREKFKDAVYIVAGLDGTIVVLNQDGTPLLYSGKKSDVMGTVTFDAVAVGNKDNILGLSDSMLYSWNATKKDWDQVQVKGLPTTEQLTANGDSLIDLAVNASGAVFILTANGDIYHNDENGKLGSGVAATTGAVSVTQAAQATGSGKGAKGKAAAGAAAGTKRLSRLHHKKQGKVNVARTASTKQQAAGRKRAARKTRGVVNRQKHRLSNKQTNKPQAGAKQTTKQ